MPTSVNSEQSIVEKEPTRPETGSAPFAEETYAFPASTSQQVFWYLHRLVPSISAFNVPLRFRMDGPLDRAILEKVVNTIIARHEVLRIRFEEEDGELQQIVQPDLQIRIEETDARCSPDPAAEAERLAAEEARRPFDLSIGPLIRANLVRVADASWVFHLTAHHSVFDGWSMRVLTTELAALYEAFHAGKPSPLPPLPLQYGDFSVWQRDFLQSPEVAAQLAYWKKQLEGMVEIDLPCDHPHPPVKSWKGEFVSLLLQADLTDRLTRIAAEEGATFFHLSLAAFLLLISRYTGSGEVTVGTPVAGRTRAELEPLIGTFVNTVLIRSKPGACRSFRELVRCVRDRSLEAVDNQDLPFETLVRELRPSREQGRNPLFQINFTHQRSFARPARFAGVQLTPLPSFSPGSIFDLHFFLVQRGEGWRVSCDYSTDLFERQTACRMLDHYRTLLESAARNPDGDLHALPMLTREEASQLAAWRGKTTAYPRDRTLPAVFLDIAACFPGRPAVVQGGEELTYADLAGRAKAIASLLRSSGVGVGDRVGIAVRRSPEMIAGIVGILLAGGAYVPIDITYPQERIGHKIRNTGMRAILSERAVAGALPRTGPTVVFSEDAKDSTGWTGEALHMLQPTDPAYVMHTSGSTGIPYGVVVPHRGVLRLVLGADYTTFGPDEVFLQAAPLSFDASTFEIWGALLHGTKLVLPSTNSHGLAGIARAVREHSVTTLWLTAGLFQAMIDEHAGELAGLRNLLAGGDVLPVAHVRKALEQLPATRLINGYGPTENTTFTTCHTIRPADLSLASIPIGRPIANTTVWILDESGRQTPVGIPGEIHTGGDGLADGYINEWELTAARFVTNPCPEGAGELLFRTGDLGRWRPDGTIEFLGRTDRQVKIRGCRVEPGEVEKALMDHPRVLQCRVGARGSDAGSKRLVAWVVLSPGEPPCRGHISSFLADRLPPYLCPDAIVIMDSLPLNENGKVDLAQLPDPAPSFQKNGDFQDSPATETERKLASICCQLLETADLPCGANLFDAGAHSLMVLRLFSLVRRAFGVSLPVASILQAPTIRSLAAAIDRAVGGSSWKDPGIPDSALVMVQPDGCLDPFYCIHGGGGGVLFSRKMAPYFGRERPLIAIESPLLNSTGELPDESVEEIAAGYVDLVCRHRPHGPLLIGGYSFGGLVAYEMATQLLQQGREVSFLAVIDTLVPGTQGRPYTLAERITKVWEEERQLGWGGALPQIAQRAILRLLQQSGVRKGGSNGLPYEDSAADRRGKELFEKHVVAMRSYRPQPIRARLTLFKAKTSHALLKFPEDYGWGPFARGGVEAVEVPGLHTTLFEDANAKNVAQALAETISGIAAAQESR